MNFRKRAAAELPQFQVTPMIDVVFLLLCFFITTAVFSQWEYAVDIVLPTASSGQIPDRLPGEVIVNVNRAGVITINSNVLTPEDLINRLTRLARLFPGQPIVVRADRETAYHQVMTVVDACRQADIWNISFATGDADAKP
jgi:biopolymer transport protein ExbD